MKKVSSVENMASVKDLTRFIRETVEVEYVLGHEFSRQGTKHPKKEGM